jgi:hypothetical protein
MKLRFVDEQHRLDWDDVPKLRCLRMHQSATYRTEDGPDLEPELVEHVLLTLECVPGLAYEAFALRKHARRTQR